MSKLILQHRRGDEDAWLDEQSPIPAEGELVVQTTAGAKSPVLKIGDGENKFEDLPSVTKDVEAAIATEKARLNAYFNRHDPPIPENEQYSELRDELEDIRVRDGGATATCAGEAVRQIDKELQDLKDSVQDLEEGVQDFIDKRAVDGLKYEGNMLYLTANNEQVGNAVGPITGGTGTGNNMPTLQLSMMLYTESLTVRATEAYVPVEYYFTSFEVLSIDGQASLEPTGGYRCKVKNDSTGKTVTYNITNQGRNTVDVKPVLSDGVNSVSIECIDTYGATRSRTANINVVSLRIEPLTNTNSKVYRQELHQTGIDIRFKIHGSVDKNVTYTVINSEGTRITTTALHSAEASGDESSYVIPLDSLQHGTNSLTVTASIGEGAERIQESFRWEFIYVATGSNTPAIASTYFGSHEISQGTNITIPYIVYDPQNDDSSVINCTVTNNGDSVTTTQMPVFETSARWSTKKYPAGTAVQFTVTYAKTVEGTLAAYSSTHTFNIESAPPVASIITDNLFVNLDASNRSNSDANRDEWPVVDSDIPSGVASVTTSFLDFNWKTNGWVLDEGTQDIALHVDGDATAIINYPLFDTKKINPVETGMTIELDFKVSNINTREAIPFNCLVDGVGLQITPQSAKLSADTTFVECNFKEDERVKVAFTIEPNENSSKFISVYLNGTLSQIKQYATLSFNAAESAFPTLHSTACSLDLYSFRVYNRCLTARQICNNYVASISDRATQINVQSANNIYTSNKVDVKLVSDRMPCIYFTAPDGMPKKKGDKQTVWMNFVNPADPNRNFSTVYSEHFNDELGGIKVEIDVQGTSSQGYVRKNWKIKLKKDDNDVPLPPYEHMEGENATNVFCLKVDYAEGTGTHNTQNANFVETLYSEAVPPVKLGYDDKVRTTIAGFPCVIFERATPTDDYVFSSKANFNFDKGSEEAFGFFDDYTNSEDGKNWPDIISTECWEFCNNTSGPCNFTNPIDFEKKWMDDFEARFLNASDRYINPALTDWYDSLETAETTLQDKQDAIEQLSKDAPDYEETKARLEAELQEFESNTVVPLRAHFQYKSRFPELHEWVRSTALYTLSKGANDQLIKTDRIDINAAQLPGGEVVIDGKTFTHDTNAYRKAKFKSEFRDYFDLHYCLIYYVYTSVALMMDQRSKNMFLTRWTTREANGNIVEKWYPYFYDNDTCFGINNEGYLVYDYYDIDTDFKGGVPVYNGYYNVLWWNFRDVFDTEIRQMYRSLRSGTNRKLDYDKLIEQFTTKGSDVWGASIYNEDAEYKYVSLARSDYSNPTDEYLYQVRGDGKLHLQYFLHNRLKYYDSKWSAEDYIDDKIVFRVNKPTAEVYIVSGTSYYGGGNGEHAEWTTTADSDATKKEVIGIRRVDGSLESTDVSLVITYNDVVYDTTDIVVTIPESGFNTYVVPTPQAGTYKVSFKTPDDNHKFYAVTKDATADEDIANSIASDVVPPNPTITLTSFSRMQGGVRYKANGSTISKPLVEGVPTPFGEDVDEQFADTETFVFGASELSSLGDLSAVYLSVADVSKATRLVNLTLGNINPRYCNKQLRQVGVGSSNKLLQTVNIYNCRGLTKELNLSGCPAIKHVLATGSSIPSVALPEAGYVETLDLPSTIKTLTIKNQPHVYYQHPKEGEPGLVSTLRVRDNVSTEANNLFNIRELNIVESPNIDTMQLLYDCLGVTSYTQDKNQDSKLSYVTLDNVRIELTSETGLEPLRALYERYNLKSIDSKGVTMDKLDIRGTCIIKCEFAGDEFAEVADHFTEALKFEVAEGGMVTSSVFFFGDIEAEDARPGENSLYTLVSSEPYATVGDPRAEIGLSRLQRPSTDEYLYTFAGWSSAINKENRIPDPSALTKVLGNRNVFPAYTRTRRPYRVTFRTGGEVLYTTEVVYNENAFFDVEQVPEDKKELLLHEESDNLGDLVPKNISSARPDAYKFTRWYPDLNTPILHETTFDAQFLLVPEGYYEPEVSKNLINPDDTDDIGYELSNQDLTITRYWVSTGTDDGGNEVDEVIVSIPDSFNIDGVDYTTKSIKNRTVGTTCTGAFQGTPVELVTVPDSVTTIGRNAFANCNKLNTITLGTGITQIEQDAFLGSNNLKCVNYNCIAASVKQLANGADPFNGCKSSQGFEFVVGDQVTKIPKSLFFQGSREDHLHAVSHVDLSQAASCSEIGDNAFSGCNITGISFYTQGTAPGPLKRIGVTAFDRNVTTTELTLPLGLTNIGARAFQSWKNLKKVNLPSTIEEQGLGAGVFAYCPELESFNVQTLNYRFDSTYGILVNKAVQNSEETLIAATKNTSISATRALKAIGENACAGCASANLSNVVFPASLQTIGQSAFAECKTMITVDGSSCAVQDLARYTFFNCSELTSIVLPADLRQIQQNCFDGCQKLTSITIPSGVKNAGSLGIYCFSNCDSLSNVVISTQEPNNRLVASTTDGDPYMFNKLKTDLTISVNWTPGTVFGETIGWCADRNGHTITIQYSDGTSTVIGG